VSAPPGTTPAPTGITGSRNTKAETNRALVGRIKRAAGHASVELEGWQVRSLMASLTANRATPTDEQITAELMRAPWWPKPRRRHFGVGEPGWRVRT